MNKTQYNLLVKFINYLNYLYLKQERLCVYLYYTMQTYQFIGLQTGHKRDKKIASII